jgi:organic radical activating enzyme
MITKDDPARDRETKFAAIDSMLEKFWSWLEQNSSKLHRLNIVGGEPLYQNEFYKILDWFESRCHPELELTIITNLMVSADRLKDVVDKFQQLLVKKKLKRIDIICSIDCWGTEQEYVRHGLDLESWLKNFEYLLSKKWLTLHINQAINVLGIKTMHVLIEKLSEWRQKRPVGHYFSSVTTPTYLSPFILGNAAFDTEFKKIISGMSEETLEHQNAKSYMTSIYKQLQNSQPNLIEMQKLKIYLNENDRRKNTNWPETFPWLVKELQNVVQ